MTSSRRRFPGFLRPLRTAALLTLLGVFLTSCTGGSRPPEVADLPEQVVIAAGTVGGIYNEYGSRLGEVLEDQLGIPVVVRETAGSVDNLQRVGSGAADLGFSTVDSVQTCTPGTEDVDVEARALARIYDDFVHLVVPAESAIEEVADLTGRRVSVGASGSGTELIAARLLDTMDVPPGAIDAHRLGLDASIAALAAGQLDAFFWSGGLRTPGLVALADAQPLRLIPLGAAAEGLLSVHGNCYRTGVIPEGVYGLTGDVSTIAVPNVLVVSSDMPDSVAKEILRVLYAEQANLAQKVPAAAMLNRTRAIFTSPVDLHPGALAYYRETKP